MPWEDGGRGQGDASTSQGMPKITSHQPKTKRGWGPDSPSQPSEAIDPANTFISEFLPPELRDSKCLWLKPPGLRGFALAAPASGHDSSPEDVWVQYFSAGSSLGAGSKGIDNASPPLLEFGCRLSVALWNVSSFPGF